MESFISLFKHILGHHEIFNHGHKNQAKHDFSFSLPPAGVFRNGDMSMIPMPSLDNFLKIFPYCTKIAMHIAEQNLRLENPQNLQCLVHEASLKGCS